MNAAAPTPPPSPPSSPSSASPSSPPTPSLSFAELAEGPRARVGDLIAAVVRFARARPYSAIVAAMAVGFVVGGALSFRGGRMLLAAGARQAGQDLLKQLL